jgi:hypothetical protein
VSKDESVIMFDEFNRLRRELEEFQRERDRTEGALRPLMMRLRKEFNCRTVDEARKKLAELEELERKRARELTAGVAKWEAENRDALEKLRRLLGGGA